MARKRIGFLCYDGIQTLDLVGPADAFAAVPADTDGEKPYEIITIGLTGKNFVSEAGMSFRANVELPTTIQLDTLIVPGGAGIRRGDTGAQAAQWIKSRAPQIRRVASVCTGIYALASTGLLDGRKVTTHWAHLRDVERRFPKLLLDSNALFVRDGKFYTSAGVTAGIDLALAMIEEDCGPSASLAVARELVVYVKRPGGQDQFSEPLQFQAKSADRFADLVAWMSSHLSADLSVETLAARTFLCARQFTRTFRRDYATTPAAFVDELRLGEASRRLSSTHANIDAVARSVGYTSVDAFRRAFERRFGVTPSSYRSRFAPERKPGSRLKARIA